MNHPSPNNNAHGRKEGEASTPPPESVRDDCLRYLLGEMSESERSSFESRLADPAVGDCLLAQAEIVDSLTQSVSTNIAPLPSPTRPTKYSSTGRSWALVTSIAAIAAGLLFLISMLPPKVETPERGEPNVELMIAKVWVQNPSLGDEFGSPSDEGVSEDWNAIASHTALADSPELGGILDTESGDVLDETELDDSGQGELGHDEHSDASSWMVAAIAAGESNDG